ncbi:MAG: stage III sporulation protein AB [Ruthenibacterium sp.]
MQLIVKFAGALLLFITGALLGCKKGEQSVLRAQLLADMVLFLRAVQNNIRYRRDTTAEILYDTIANCRMRRLVFLLEKVSAPMLPQALQTALGKMENETGDVILPQEMQQFARALLHLGGGSAEEETQKLSFTIATLENAAQEAEQQAKIQRRLYRTMGFSGGVAAALLFL